MNVKIKCRCKVLGTGPSTYHSNCSVSLSSLFPIHSGCIFQVLPPLVACSVSSALISYESLGGMSPGPATDCFQL